MVRVNVVSTPWIDISREYDINETRTRKPLKDTCTVEVVEHNISEITGVDTEGGKVAFGTYFSNLNIAEVMSIQSQRVAEILKEKGVDAQKSVLIFEVGHGGGVSLSMTNKKICNIFNNFTHRKVVESILPFDVDYVVILNLVNDASEVTSKLEFTLEKENEKIGIATADVYIAEVK